ncbi:universal stress protein [Microbacterium sp. NPDC089318]
MTVIIVGVDGSATALRAAETARSHALALQARLHVVTAFDSDRTEVYGSGSDQTIASTADNAVQTARDVAKQLEAPGLAVTFSAARGKPAEALIEEAERNDAQMIVVGNLRMRGIGRVLGSVANSVAHNAPCDVLIVKTDEPLM